MIGPTEGAAGPSRLTIVIPPPPPTRIVIVARGRGRAKGRGRGRPRGRVFYPPSSRFSSHSTAPLTSGTEINHEWDLNHS